MQLTGDRLEVEAGERVHALVLVTVPEAVVASEGGVDHLRHEIGDVGFREVEVSVHRPDTWHRGEASKPTSLDWLVWVAATPVRSASLSRDLTEELTVLDAWEASADGQSATTASHPYSLVCFRAGRVFGVLRVYGFAYPALGKEGTC